MTFIQHAINLIGSRRLISDAGWVVADMPDVSSGGDGRGSDQVPGEMRSLRGFHLAVIEEAVPLAVGSATGPAVAVLGAMGRNWAVLINSCPETHKRVNATPISDQAVLALTATTVRRSCPVAARSQRERFSARIAGYADGWFSGRVLTRHGIIGLHRWETSSGVTPPAGNDCAGVSSRQLYQTAAFYFEGRAA